MTRKELIELANREYERRNAKFTPIIKRVNTCQAWVITWDFCDFAVIKSYKTIVGIYSKPTATLFVFDYYSSTTQQHLRKAAKLLKADRVTFLYERTDNIVELSLSSCANTHKLSSKEMEQVKNLDFSTYICEKPFR